MKTPYNLNRINVRETLFVIMLAFAWIEDYKDNEDRYKEHGLAKNIDKIIPRVLKFGGKLTAKVMGDLLEEKAEVAHSVDAEDFYWLYRVATFYLKGVEMGAIKDDRKVIDGTNYMYIKDIYKRADELEKELED